MSRNILHIDVTDFHVAVERVMEPRLKDRPVAVAIETASRALVFALSREAAANGVRRGMPVHDALKICPGLTVLPPNEDLYRRATVALLELLGQFTPVIEPLRFGHAYLDLTGSVKLFGGVVDAAARAQNEIRRRLRLDANAGVASNKLVSKVATDVVTSQSRKPGLCDVGHGQEEPFLAPLRVGYLPEVQKTTQEQLRDLNVHLIRELASLSAENLQMVFGRLGIALYQHARGIDNRPVQPTRRAPQIVELESFDDDTNDYQRLQSALFRLLARAARRLRQSRLFTGRLVVEVRYSDCQEGRAQQRLPAAQDDWALLQHAESVLQHAVTRRVRIRQLTLRLCDLTAASDQLDFFATPPDPKQTALTRALDKIRDRYGDRAIGFGRAA